MDLGKLLEESGAVLRGHFVLTSGRHSDVYFEKFRVLEQPKVLSALCAEIAEYYAGSAFDFVAGPATGGIIIAFEVARQMGLTAVYIEPEAGKKTLRRGKTLPAGANVLVVDDVLTTGTSLFESRVAIEEAGAEVGGYAVLIDRVQRDLEFTRPYFAAYKVEAVSYAEDEIPDWLASIPAVKPGTRKPQPT
jgi:orotate phosphoribosyltransferase